MQQILAFTRKELQLWAQKPGSWILVFIVPLILIWIMQAVFGSSVTPVMTIYAVDADKSTRSERVMQTLRSADQLNLVELETREEASKRVSAGERMAAVIIPNGFSQAVALPGGAKIEIIIDPARSEQASIVSGLVNAALAPAIVEAEVSRGVEDWISPVLRDLPVESSLPEESGSPDQAPQPLPEQTPPLDEGPNGSGGSDGSAELPGSGEPAGVGGPGTNNEPQTNPVRMFFTTARNGIVASQVEEALANPQVTIDAKPIEGKEQQAARRPSLLDYLVPGYSLMFVFFLISSIAATVIEERQAGALNRLLVAPVPRSRILLGKMIPYFLIAVAQFAVILLASRLIFGLHLGNSLLALIVIILASALAVVSLGILIAAFAHSQGQASSLTIILVLAMAVVSGAMFPNISIPGIQALTPHYWAMQGFVNTIARGQDVQGVLLPAGVLLTMSAVFFTVGAVRFRFE